MGYREFDRARDFLDVTLDFLKTDEAVNGLMLSITRRLCLEPDAYGTRPYFGVIDHNGGLVLAALMTPPHRLQLLSVCKDCPLKAVTSIASALESANWPVPGVLARIDLAEGFASAWSALTGGASEIVMRERIHSLEKVNPIALPPGEIRRAGEGDADLAAEWGRLFHQEALGAEVRTSAQAGSEIGAMTAAGKIYLWCDRAGRPVSMAARVRPTENGESISWVYTPAAERRKGYASAVVAGLSRLLLSEGKKFCTLYTDLSNPTSNKIYRLIGYAPRADVAALDFILAEG